MGSFNEVCALSGMNIGFEDKVRTLFLTQNPYAKADEHEAHRGVYPQDNWFLRTPPIKGKYDDYGRSLFKVKDPIVELIADMFEQDMVVRPFGFNQYHASDVSKGKGIKHLLKAAWDGRLLVQDEYSRPREQPPENWPTWDRVQTLLEEAKKTIQSKSKKEEGSAGYNAQPVLPGIVCVTFNAYSEELKKLEKIKPIIEKKYDCNIVWKFKDHQNDPCLIVTAKGAFEKPEMLADIAHIKHALETHPELRDKYRQLPVLAVMVREDVWQTYVNVSNKSQYSWNEVYSKDKLLKMLRNNIKEIKSASSGMYRMSIAFREVLKDIPFQVLLGKHLEEALKRHEEGTFPDDALEELIQITAEAARVEHVMGHLHQCWYIPTLGGQDGNWSLRSSLLKGFLEISDKEHKKEMSECEDCDEEEQP